MRKVFALILAILLVGVPVEVGADGVDLLIGTQETGTAGYTYSTAIMNCLQTIEGYKVSLVTNSSGNLVSPILIQERECDITISNSAPALWAATTGIPTAGVPVCEDIRCIAGGFGRDFINVMFTAEFVAKTGITSIEELVEKEEPVRLAIKKNGSFGELAAEQVFGVLGIDINDAPAWLSVKKMSGSSIKDALCDGDADLTIDHIGAGQANTTELCINHDMIDVQLADDTLSKLCEQGYYYITVPADTWAGQNVDIKSVGSQQCIIVSADMPNEVAYNITKAICENTDILSNASYVLTSFNPQVAGLKALTGCDLHPGAAQYYEEMGYPHSEGKPVDSKPEGEEPYSMQLTIPESTTEIQANAFENDVRIRTVVLPKSLKTIGSRAFAGCKNLKMVVFQSAETMVAVDAFMGCENVKFVYPTESAIP